MEIFGGFMVMMSILALFLTVIWFITPFVVFAIMGKQDRSLEILERIDKRLLTLEQHLNALQTQQASHETAATDLEEAATPASGQTPLKEL
ncbi:MAG: hypothetical protein M0T70_12780 [Geobacteraceae bacterium]|nr:hypothetical protein [Geobacteraceae bacterium]